MDESKLDENRIGRKQDWTKIFGPKQVGRKQVGRKLGARYIHIYYVYIYIHIYIYAMYIYPVCNFYKNLALKFSRLSATSDSKTSIDFCTDYCSVMQAIEEQYRAMVTADTSLKIFEDYILNNFDK